MGEINVKSNLEMVWEKINTAKIKREPELQCVDVRLVAATKIKSVDLIIEAYEAGQRHFGENYVQELEEKAKNPLLLHKCKEIRWHYIGHLQSNKINKILSIPNIYLIETVHSVKLAATLNKSWPKYNVENKLKVLVQVNTSAEEAKSGIEPKDVVELTRYVLEECPNLEFEGLMTIGQYYYDTSKGPNPDFLTLRKCREEICEHFGLDWKKVHLSMGMSADYQQAVELGSTNVRVGEAIFGQRIKKIHNMYKALDQ